MSGLARTVLAYSRFLCGAKYFAIRRTFLLVCDMTPQPDASTLLTAPKDRANLPIASYSSQLEEGCKCPAATRMTASKAPSIS